MRPSQARDKNSPSTPKTADLYDSLHRRFGWQVPEHFNMAQVCMRRWAGQAASATRTAVIACAPGQPERRHSYGELMDQANRLSNALAALGVQRGDRVAIVLPQRFETAVAYMAVLQMGAVGMPLSQLFGPDALEYRLHDSEAVVAICDQPSLGALLGVRDNCPLLRAVIGLDGDGTPEGMRADLDWTALLAQEPADFAPVNTLADEAAVLIYTSGTTGNPKGALIPHRALIGNLSGFVCSQNWFGFDPFDASVPSQAVFWSPADWAWTGGLMDALLPTLYFGRPIVGYNGRFSPQTAFELMQRHGVTHSFLFPTALKAMMKAVPKVRPTYRLKLQALMSAGEAVGDAVFAYCRDQLGVTVNEMFGQTEINYIVGNCARLWPAKPGSMGKGYPGHRVAVIDDEGRECAVGVPGDVAVHRLDLHGMPDPIFFLGYWKNDGATRAKYTGDPANSWCRTGDLATRDAEGYLWYQGRADDVFKAAGYRIGPSEIENCLVKHPAVANAAVVPKPDAERGAVVKAYVVLAPGHVGDEALVKALQAHVKGMLAPYEYPKEIEFIDALPMTTTGKVQRRVLRLREEELARLRS
ncbi:acyl-CoA synthetase [Hydrogenophaga sp.]|uniref:acyl-CoA synthetase n=1 Tax=Hydrogenophaga sp. TaxID=1904254 RepID=UPI003F705D78